MTDHHYYVEYDGSMTYIRKADESSHGEYTEGFATFTEAKAAALDHLRARRDEYVYAVNHIRTLRKDQV